MFGRRLYPGDAVSYKLLKQSDFTTVMRSSFYIHADGDLYSGDLHQPIIHKINPNKTITLSCTNRIH